MHNFRMQGSSPLTAYLLPLTRYLLPLTRYLLPLTTYAPRSQLNAAR